MASLSRQASKAAAAAVPEVGVADAGEQLGDSDMVVAAGGEQQNIASEADENDQRRRKTTKWLQTEPFPRMVITRAVLGPLQRMQRAQLWVGSAKWEKEQQALEARAVLSGAGTMRRSYPVVEAAEGAAEEDCMKRLLALLGDHKIWRLVPQEAYTAKHVGLAHVAVCRAAALVYRRLCLPHAHFPYKLFLAVRHERMVDELKAVKPCMRCPFSSEYLAQVDLSTDVAQQTLLMLAKVADMNIAEIECRHAALRRYLTRVQAKLMDLEDLAANWVAQRYRRRQLSFSVTLGQGDAPSGSSDASASAGERGQAASKPTKEMGPWRMFVAMETAGRSGTADLGEVATKYRALSPDTQRSLQDAASALARAKAPDEPTSSGVGLGRRETERALRQRERDIQADRLQLVSLAPDVEPHFADDLFPVGKGLQDALKQCRWEHKVLTQRREAIAEQHALEIRRFQEHAAEFSRGFFSDGNGLGDIVPSIIATPCAKAPTFLFNPPVATAAARLVSFCNEHNKKTNLHLAMDANFVGKHKLRSHSQAPPLSHAGQGGAATRAASPCWKRFFCICDERGKNVRLFANKIMARLKKLAPRGSDMLKSMRGSMVYLELQGWDTEQDPDDPIEHQIWHVSDVSLSPYECVFHDMVWDGIIHNLGRMELQGSGSFYYHLEAFNLCRDLKLKWKIRLHTLDMSDRVVAEFVPGTISCFPASDFHNIAGQTRRRLRRRRPQEGHPTPEVAQPVLESVGPDGDGELSAASSAKYSDRGDGPNQEEGYHHEAWVRALDEDRLVWRILYFGVHPL